MSEVLLKGERAEGGRAQALVGRRNHLGLGRWKMRHVALCVFVVIAALTVTPTNSASALGQHGESTIDNAVAGQRVLSGRVTDAGTGAPLPRPRVVVIYPRTSPESWSADEDGRFAIPVSETRPLSVQVSKAGYVTTIANVDRRSTSGLVIPLTRAASVGGRVLDSVGGAAMAVAVAVRGVSRQPADKSNTFSRLLTTDDLGEYRVGNLPPGRYEIGVIALPAPFARSADALRDLQSRLALDASVLPPFAPSATVDVKAGEEISGVDFSVQAEANCSNVLATAQPTTQAFQGRVVDATGQPLGCVNVGLSSADGPLMTTFSDARGYFSFATRPVGNYGISAGKPGYSLSRTEREPGGARTVTNRNKGNGTVVDVRLVLTRGSAITGTVLDEHGDPVVGARVSVLQLRAIDGRTVAAAVPGVASRETDDRGHYRLFGLTTGTYVVESVYSGGVSQGSMTARTGYPPAYYPSSPSIDFASRVPVELGKDVPGVLITHQRMPTWRVTGSVVDPGGQPLRGAVTLTVSERSGSVALAPRRGQVKEDGTFVFNDVLPGDYVVQAVGTNFFGMEFVTIGSSDPAPLRIRAGLGATIEGTLVREGIFAEPGPGRLSILTLPVSADYSPIGGLGPVRPVTVAENQLFRISGLFGPRQFILASQVGNSYLKGVRINGRDVIDEPFDFGRDGKIFEGVEVVVGAPGGTVIGRVVSERNEHVVGATVITFPPDATKWVRYSRFVKIARSGHDGSFKIEGLPPGDYQLGVTTHPVTPSQLNTRLLETLAVRARPIRLSEGQQLEAVVSLADK